MDQKILQKIIRNLQNKVRCPACGHQFKKSEIKFRGFFREVYLFEFGCPVCSTMLFAKVLVNQPSQPRFQNRPIRLRDISPIKEFSLPQKKITTNSIIQLHQELKSFDGDFEKLFS
jgi:hypothetical protein